jgi:hypothetical protein
MVPIILSGSAFVAAVSGQAASPQIPKSVRFVVPPTPDEIQDMCRNRVVATLRRGIATSKATIEVLEKRNDPQFNDVIAMLKADIVQSEAWIKRFE